MGLGNHRAAFETFLLALVLGEGGWLQTCFCEFVCVHTGICAHVYRCACVQVGVCMDMEVRNQLQVSFLRPLYLGFFFYFFIFIYLFIFGKVPHWPGACKLGIDLSPPPSSGIANVHHHAWILPSHLWSSADFECIFNLLCSFYSEML